jgi:beta-carotene hydroxylase
MRTDQRDLAPGNDRARPAALSGEELAVVRRLSGGFGWPTVLLAIALTCIEAGMITLLVVGIVPIGIGFVLTSFVAYAWYTVHHDATHKAISGRNPRWRWIEVSCGTLAGFAMQLEFSSYARNHLRHHAHTNTPGDPDLAVKGPLWAMPIKWAVAPVFMTIGALPGGQRIVQRVIAKLGVPLPDSERDRADFARMRRLTQVGLVILVATIPLGWFWPAFYLWWLPTRVGVFYLMVFFQWLPHFPFDRTDRFGATRINRFPGSTWVLLQQDRHLIHHLYPQIPWYRYRAAFRELRPLLEENGAIIQGTGTSPHVPIQLRELAPAGA